MLLVTWNLQGGHGFDAATAAGRLRALAGRTPDVVVLQEVQPAQARRLAKVLGHESHWVFKHWPLPRGMEGLAVLAPPGAVRRTHSLVLRRAAFWSWRRRVALLAEIEGIVVADVHLSPDSESRRQNEAAFVVAAVEAFADGLPVVIAGDLNDLDETGGRGALATHGYRDAWEQGAGATNWTGGRRAGRPPTQRLDSVLVGPGMHADAWIPGPDVGTGYDTWAELSDHLPLVATVQRMP